MKDLTLATDNRTAIADIKRRYAMGEISRDEAKQLAQPVIDVINLKQAEIAKRYGKKNYQKMDFIGLMR